MDEPGAQGKGLTVQVYFDFEAVSDMSDEWDEFVLSVEGDIFFSYDWCRIWWKYYGEGRCLRIYLFRRAGKLVGLAPFFIERLWLGITHLRAAKVVGADFTSSMANFPLQGDDAQEILGQLINDLMSNEKCDSLWFSPLADNHPALSQIRVAMQSNLGVTALLDRVKAPYSLFKLPTTQEAYLSSLPKRQRGNLRRDQNLLDKSFTLTQDIIADAEQVRSEFASFVNMHTDQWKAVNELGHFYDWPRGVEFNTEMAVTQAEKGRCRLVRLIANGGVASYQLCYAFGKRWHWRLPARLVGPGWDKFALGRNGLSKMIELAIDEGVSEIEGGAGHYEYKCQLGAVEYELHSILLARDTLSCRLRLRVFVLLSEIFHVCYYRIWFKRIAPKLPFRRRPLWRAWIRARP